MFIAHCRQDNLHETLILKNTHKCLRHKPNINNNFSKLDLIWPSLLRRSRELQERPHAWIHNGHTCVLLTLRASTPPGTVCPIALHYAATLQQKRFQEFHNEDWSVPAETVHLHYRCRDDGSKAENIYGIRLSGLRFPNAHTCLPCLWSHDLISLNTEPGAQQLYKNRFNH